MADKNNSKQVNVDFSNFPELLESLEQMVTEDMTDRSKFIRNLIRQEKERRQQPHSPTTSTKTRVTRRKSAERSAAAMAA